MSNKILIPIHPQYVNLIIKGEKKFEYRTRIPKKNINEILIYATYPIKKVLAKAKIKKILKLKPMQLWLKTEKYSGIDRKCFNQYFKNKKIAYAYEIDNVSKYKKPKKLIDYNIKYSPQSYVYI